MRFRKLRIAWSVAWGIACLLLIALWVRSYWRADGISFPISRTHLLGFGSVEGEITAVKGDYAPGYFKGHYEIGSFPIVDRRIGDNRPQSMPGYRGAVGFGFIQAAPFFVFCAPHWFLVGLTGAVGIVAWIKDISHFSLRTLLIATTLVAVVLGLIVWLRR
jgi:hypothetical protein